MAALMKQDVATIAHNMSDGAVECRSLLHAWKPDTAWKVRGGFEVTYKCARKCGSKRQDFISTKGEVLARSYSYEADYRIEGLGRAPAGFRDHFRLEAITRLAPAEKPVE